VAQGEGAQQFAQALATSLRSSVPLIVIDSVEEQRVVGRVAEVAAGLGMRCLAWDVVTGFTSVTEQRPMAPSTDAIDVLSRLRAMSSDTVVVLKARG
jgi:hypothetical protein